jgi:hypothetical protein
VSLRRRRFSRLALGFGGRRVLFGGRGGLAVTSRSTGRSGILFRSFLIFVAAVIGNVKPAAFKDETSAAADGAFDFALAPALLRAQIFGTDLEPPGRHRLEFLKLVSALFADILVGRHTGDGIAVWRLSVKEHAGRVSGREKMQLRFVVVGEVKALIGEIRRL